jgi:hypothetical protein
MNKVEIIVGRTVDDRANEDSVYLFAVLKTSRGYVGIPETKTNSFFDFVDLIVAYASGIEAEVKSIENKENIIVIEGNRQSEYYLIPLSRTEELQVQITNNNKRDY